MIVGTWRVSSRWRSLDTRSTVVEWDPIELSLCYLSMVMTLYDIYGHVPKESSISLSLIILPFTHRP